jgi:hypothetical protein
VTSAFTVDTYQSMVHATIKHTNYPILHLRLSPTDPLSHPISYPLFQTPLCKQCHLRVLYFTLSTGDSLSEVKIQWWVSLFYKF